MDGKSIDWISRFMRSQRTLNAQSHGPHTTLTANQEIASSFLKLANAFSASYPKGSKAKG
jgi:hypothetical protein